MSKIYISELKDNEYAKWNELVEISPHSTIFHNLDWLKIVEKHTNSKLYLFVGYLGDEVIGAIPFFYENKYLFKYLSSPPSSAMIQNLGPIIPNYENLKQDKREHYFRDFQKELDNYILSKMRRCSISIISPPNLIDARPYIWTNYQTTPRYNYIRDIQNLDLVWGGFKKILRKNILNSERNGIEIEEGEFDSYNLILKSLSMRLEEQESKLPVSSAYMLDLYHRFSPKNLKIFIARHNKEQVSGIIFLTYKDKLSIWVGATRANLKGLYPVDLLQWEIIKWGNENGFKYCEILGANIPSISYFKSRYNFDLEIYFYAVKLNSIYNIYKNVSGVLANHMIV